MTVNDIIPYLKSVAAQKAYSDSENFNPCDHSGGNYDDAYNLGLDDGDILFARDLLRKLGVPF